MRKLALVVLAAALFLFPQAAFAQAAQPQAPLLPQVQAEVQAQAQKVGDIFGLSANQVLAIGIGAVGGVVVAEVLDVAIILGGIVGGVLGNWWYAEHANTGIAGMIKK